MPSTPLWSYHVENAPSGATMLLAVGTVVSENVALGSALSTPSNPIMR